MKIKSPKQKKRLGGAGIGVAIATVAFIVLGAVFLIIGYHDTVLDWMKTVGISFLVVALIPIIYIAYQLVQKRIDS